MRRLMFLFLLTSMLATAGGIIARHPRAYAANAPVGNDSYTVLLLHCDGDDESTTFTDSSAGGADSPHTLTAQSDAQIDTAQSKFGGAAGLFDGTDDYVTVPDSADWDFGSGDFTIDFWCRFANTSGSDTFIDQFYDSRSFEIVVDHNADELQFKWSTDGSNVNGGANTWNPSADTWYHVAIVRYGNTATGYVNGSSVGTWDMTGVTISNSNEVLWIGAMHTGSGGDTPLNFMDGWLDEFRISKGIARWTSNFTPPTSAYGP